MVQHYHFVPGSAGALATHGNPVIVISQNQSERAVKADQPDPGEGETNKGEY